MSGSNPPPTHNAESKPHTEISHYSFGDIGFVGKRLR